MPRAHSHDYSRSNLGAPQQRKPRSFVDGAALPMESEIELSGRFKFHRLPDEEQKYERADFAPIFDRSREANSYDQ